MTARQSDDLKILEWLTVEFAAVTEKLNEVSRTRISEISKRVLTLTGNCCMLATYTCIDTEMK